MRAPVLITISALVLTSCWSEAAAAEKSFHVLVYSKTTLFRHDSITNGIVALKKLAQENSFQVDATEDSSVFTADNLKKYRVVVFLNTSGEIFNSEQENIFRTWLENGGGLVGVHAAAAGKSATEGSWEWYGELFCTQFTQHPPISEAVLNVEDQDHPATKHLPKVWKRTDEWYNYAASPRGKAHVLMTIDESTFKGGTMGADHPMSWWRDQGKGRFWYTALGHTAETYTEPLFLQHLLGGIRFVAREE